jgi:ribulose-5-phosphate 4-epimerase/fuculose-1-phosphate aldolase
VDDQYDGLAVEEEVTRCARLLSDPQIKVLVMGNHDVLLIGDGVADCFNRLYYFERAAVTYIRALQTGQPLRFFNDEVAKKTAQELEGYPNQANAHLNGIRTILDLEGSN